MGVTFSDFDSREFCKLLFQWMFFRPVGYAWVKETNLLIGYVSCSQLGLHTDAMNYNNVIPKRKIWIVFFSLILYIIYQRVILYTLVLLVLSLPAHLSFPLIMIEMCRLIVKYFQSVFLYWYDTLSSSAVTGIGRSFLIVIVQIVSSSHYCFYTAFTLYAATCAIKWYTLNVCGFYFCITALTLNRREIQCLQNKAVVMTSLVVKQHWVVYTLSIATSLVFTTYL